MKASAPQQANRQPPWDALLDGRFDSKHPGRTLWSLFSEEHRSIAFAVALYVVKQAPASLLPLAVGMIVDALTPLQDGSMHRVLIIAAVYLALLA